MVATWMLYASLLGALLGLSALALEFGVRSRLALTRWIWMVAIGATCVIPLIIALRSNRSAPLTVMKAPTLPEISTPARTMPPPSRLSRGIEASNAPARQIASIPTIDTPRLDRLLLVAWLLSSLCAAGLMVRSLFALRRRQHSWAESDVDGIGVWVSHDVGPSLVGFVRPRIVLPEWALHLEQPGRELMLQHELEHQRAGDPVLLAAAAFIAVLMPWNAAIWWQAARLRMAIEIDCDARVLSRVGRVREYASLLVAVGERMSPSAHWAPAFVEHRSSLERRIVAMSDVKRSRRWTRPVMAIGAATLCVVLACEAPTPEGLLHRGADRMPALLPSDTLMMPPRVYPRLEFFSFGDSTTQWIRASVTRLYPRALVDPSVLFVTLFVDDQGVATAAGGQERPIEGRRDTPFKLELPYVQEPSFRYDDDSASGGRDPGVEAERRPFFDSGFMGFMSAAKDSAGFGIRTVFPRHFIYDAGRATLLDPFLGADPQDFQRDDDLFLPAGAVGPRPLEVHVLVFKPGQEYLPATLLAPSTQSRVLIAPLDPKDTAAFSMLGPDVLAAVAKCHQPACTPEIITGLGHGEVWVGLDSANHPHTVVGWAVGPGH